jgi:threonine dehydrogenase-like Zn-dependent dehydrogenase
MRLVMKALVLTSFGRLDVEDRPTPTPADDETVIEIIATGICGSDIHGFTGDNGRRQLGQIMGHETVGRIAALGTADSRPDLAVGDIVTFNPVVRPADAYGPDDPYRGREQHDPQKYVIGVRADVAAAFAQYIAVPTRNVVKLPSTMPIEYGALIEPLAVAVHAVRRSTVKAGDRVLVIGGGPIGQSVVLALRMAGVQNIAVVELTPSRRDLVERLGAIALAPATEPMSDVVERALGGLADVAIDAVGISATVATALDGTRLGATVCLVGMGAKRLELDAFSISTEERSIVGSFTYSNSDFEAAAQWIGTAPAEAAALISRSVAMADADSAFRSLASGDDTPGKVLVLMNDGD